jgi:hypothetical protein
MPLLLQVFIKWAGLEDAQATWEDYHHLQQRFPSAPLWLGEVPSQGGDCVTVYTSRYRRSGDGHRVT